MSTSTSTNPQVSAARTLRDALHAPRLARAMGAHSPLSARLAEEAGFDVIWSSGLEISATAGMPDANILTMSECLDVAAAMASAVRTPVLADCDSGYGNVTNVRHMIHQYEARGIAGVCIEDKQFPKLNSFVEGTQDLVPVWDFAAKIAAAVAARRDPDFVVVARLEALIAGLPMAEALLRARAYEEAGADALLIHSKRSEPDEIFEFVDRYDGELPVVVVPTTYARVTVADLTERGIAMAIYANQGLRSSVRAVRDTLRRIIEDGTTHHVEDDIAPLKEIFDLQGVAAMLTRQEQFEDAGRAVEQSATAWAATR